MLGAPDARETRGRILLQQILAARPEKCNEATRENAHVRDGEVHALRTGRRHDVRGIAGKKETSILHWLDDETSHWREQLLEHRAFVEPPAVVGLQPRVQLAPDARVGPFVDIFIGRDLQIQARHFRRTPAE